MPTYQYACTACGEQLEAVQAFTDPPLTRCPTCRGQLRKVFSAVGVVFKGSGFYRNDSRSTPAGTAAPDKAAPDKAAAAAGETKAGSSAAAAGSAGAGSSGSSAAATTGSSAASGSSRSPAAKSA